MDWRDELKLGDIIQYQINCDYKLTGEVKEFIIDSEELLNNIKRFETSYNFHNMKIVGNINNI